MSRSAGAYPFASASGTHGNRDRLSFGFRITLPALWKEALGERLTKSLPMSLIGRKVCYNPRSDSHWVAYRIDR